MKLKTSTYTNTETHKEYKWEKTPELKQKILKNNKIGHFNKSVNFIIIYFALKLTNWKLIYIYVFRTYLDKVRVAL